MRKESLEEQETKSKEQINYEKLSLSKKENISFYTLSFAILFALGFLFYKDVILSLVLCLLVIPLKKVYIDFLKKKREKLLVEGFRDLLYSISASIAAGRQMPEALKNSLVQLRTAYGEDSDIFIEVNSIVRSYEENHADIGMLFSSFAARCKIGEIKQFADSYRVCRKCGGDLEGVALKSASLLLEKIDFQGEVNTLISEKKLDIVILTAMPILILLFLNLSSKDYILVLYESLVGRIIMTICLLLIFVSLYWGMKITDLKI